METYFPIKVKPKTSRARRVIKLMRSLIQEEKPLAAELLYKKCRSKTRQDICRILRVKTKKGVMKKLTPAPWITDLCSFSR